MWNKVECPYCKHEKNMDDCFQDLDSNNMVDVECSNCDEEFEVYVEFEPTFSANKIIYDECECCGKEVRDIKKRGIVYPYPKNIKENMLCDNCWMDGVRKDLEEKPGY